VLRSHLLTMLVEERGEPAAREHHLRAGRLLEDAGAFPEALSAYSRGQDWASAERILGRTGEALVERPTTWLDALPPSLVRHDPWLLLASARYARDEGRWGVAIDAYQRAEKAFGSADAALVCRRERISLAGWLSPAPTPGGAWSDRLRSATIRDPGATRRLAEDGGDWSDRLVAGVALLLAGSPVAAREVLAQVIDDEAVPPPVAAGAALAEAIGALMVDDRTWNDRLEAAANAAERLSVRWLARSGRAVLAAARDPDGPQVAADIAACREDGDRWGEALIELGRAWFAAGGGDRKPADRAAAIVRDLGAGTLEGWARALAALAAAVGDDDDARDTAFAADAQARTVGTPGPRLLAFLALRQADLQGDDTYESIAADLRTETGLSLPPHRPHSATRSAAGAARTNGAVAPAGGGATGRRAARDPGVAPAQARRMPATARPGVAAPLRVTCFGGYTIRVGDEPVDLGLVKPRSRVLLRFLSLHAGTWVHREVITEALWPDGDRDSPARSLQVGLSTVRRLLEPDSERASAYLVRDADAYRLELPPGSWVDHSELERGIAQGHAARAAGDEQGARDWLRRSLEAYRGDLLPEDGPATWVVEPRERIRGLAARAGEWLAELSLAAGDPAEATRASLAGLAIDRYSDPLWRLLISAREAAGDHGAASRARQEYAVVLAGLGVAGDDDDGDGAPGPPARSRATRRDPSSDGGGQTGAHGPGSNGAGHVASAEPSPPSIDRGLAPAATTWGRVP
jgi:DNA-binding SARP family transcriptional activator